LWGALRVHELQRCAHWGITANMTSKLLPQWGISKSSPNFEQSRANVTVQRMVKLVK
jgi:hypothetical protein